MALVLVDGPDNEPLSAADFKTHARIDVSDEDTLITGYLKAVRLLVERLSGHRIITQTWDYFVDDFPAGEAIEIPYPPLQSVTGVYYTDEAGDESTMDADDYWVDTHGRPGRVVLMDNHTWPTATLRSVHGVRVRFVCGYGDAAEDITDEELLQAIRLLAGHYYEFREEVVVGRVAAKMESIPFGVQALLADLRTRSLRRVRG